MMTHDAPMTAEEPADRSVAEQIRALLDKQPFAVLCTQSGGQPYGSVVSYAFGDDLRSLAFVTPVNTFKYRQLCECDRVALVIDSAPAQADAIMRGEAITMIGQATEIGPGAQRDRWVDLLAERHPQIRDFLTAPTNALFCVDVTRYAYVARFQDTAHWEP